MPDLITFILRHWIGILATISALALDQTAKAAVMRTMEVGQSWPTQGFWHITRASNTGATLDLFSGHTVFLIIVSAVGIGLLFALYWPRPKTGVRPQLAFGLMLAGAAGNLIDRIVSGHVIDFINVTPWFIFNIADMAILIGLIGFAWDIPEVTARLMTESRERS